MIRITINFDNADVNTEELEAIIIDNIIREIPNAKIKKFVYSDDGVTAILDDGENVFVEIDWDEIKLLLT